MTETDFPKKIAENVTMYSADPIVYVVNDFLNDHECNSFIEAGKNKLKESTVISSDQHVTHKSRTSQNCWLTHDENDILHEVSKRISILVPSEMLSNTNLFIMIRLANIKPILTHLTIKQRKERRIGSLVDNDF